MNTCPTCGQPVHDGPVYTLPPMRGIVVDGQRIPLTRSEMIIAEMLLGAMKREPVHQDYLLIALYDLDEPKNPVGNLRLFIFKIRLKLDSTNLRLRYFRPEKYGFVYEARKAA